MMKKQIIFAILALTFLMANAQDSEPLKTSRPFGFMWDFLSPKPANLTRLIDEKKLDTADDYLMSERQYFLVENKKEQLFLLQRLSTAFNAMYEPEMDNLMLVLNKVSGEAPDRWAEERSVISKSNTLMSDYKKLQIFSEPEFQTPKLALLTTALTATQSTLASAALEAFKNFDHSSAESFFTQYPYPLAVNFFATNAASFEAFIKQLNVAQIVHLKSKYPEHIGSNSKFTELLQNRFIEVSLPIASVPHSIGKVLTVIKNAKAAGFPVKNIPGAKITFVEVTSKTLLSEGQIEFPTQIDMDLPFEPIKADVDTVLDSTEKAGSNLVIILNVTTSSVARRIISKKDLTSKFVSGTRTDPNPEFQVAQNNVFESQNGLTNARSKSSGGGFAVALINGIAVGMWSNKLQEAQRTLGSTPMMVKSDEFQPYKYSSSDISATRIMTANYFVIDKTTNRYYKGSLDISENKSFKIAYNISEKDPESGKIVSQFSKESDIAAYEQSPMSLQVSLLIDDYLKNEEKSKTLQSIVALRDEMLVDKNKALTAYKSNQYTAKAINDARFDSVVVMNNPKGMLGTGFFVTPDLVMTNYHVIEGAQFIEMKLYNGLETFGKVVKTDVRLDLALVKVQTRGTPVNLFEGNNLDLGATVEAIGHPKGLTFTITRGIVSAVRKKPSIYAVGGKDVLFVQTDAAINPGNSGGPLFLGDKVIGVNNNKMVAGSEGLGFSIHYSEVKEFLKDSF